MSRLVRFGSLTRSVAAVAFDKDGTLLDSQCFWHELYRIRRTLIADMAGEAVAAAWEGEVGAAGGQFDRRGPFAVAPMTEEATLLAGLLYRTLGWGWDQCRQSGLELCLEANRRLDVARVAVARPGAVDMVRSLKAAGVLVGVVTSDQEDRARQGLSLVGLPDETWDFFFTPAHVARPKPAPDMILGVMGQTGLPPAAIAVVGDSIVDLRMARAAGSLAVAVPEYAEDGAYLEPLADVVLQGPHEIRLAEEGDSCD